MRVVLRFTADGEVEFLSDEPIELLSIDERAEHDRVLRITRSLRVSRETIEALVAGHRVGQIGDRPELEAEIAEALGAAPSAKKPRLN